MMAPTEKHGLVRRCCMFNNLGRVVQKTVWAKSCTKPACVRYAGRPADAALPRFRDRGMQELHRKALHAACEKAAVA